MNAKNIIAWVVLAVAVVGLVWYWYTRRNPAGYFGKPDSKYKLSTNDHFTVVLPARWPKWTGTWDGTVTRSDGVVVKKVDLWYERLANKIKPGLKLLGVSNDLLNDPYVANYITAFYKGVDIDPTGLEADDVDLRTALANYLNSGDIAYDSTVVQVGQFIDPTILASLLNSGGQNLQGFTAGNDMGLTFDGYVPANYNQKPDGTNCPKGQGWCSNANRCVYVTNNAKVNGVLGFDPTDIYAGAFPGAYPNTYTPCDNWQPNQTAGA